MKKFIAFLSVAAIVAMMSGCGTDPAATKITITIESIGSVVAGASGAAEVTGKIDADSELTDVSMRVLDNSGVAVAEDKFIVYHTSAYTGKKSVNLKTDLNTTIKAVASVTGGTYKLEITAKAGSVESITSKEFTVTGGNNTTLAEKTLILGAQGTTTATPTLLDADSMVGYSLNTTDSATLAKVDVIFYYSTAVVPAELRFVSPSIAQGSPFDSWKAKPAAEYKNVTSTANFDNTTTQSQINTLWGNGPGEARLAVSTNMVIVIKTNAGVYKLAKILSIDGSNSTATMSVKGKY